MHDIITLLFCGILILIAWYDFKYRALPLWLLITALLFGILFSLTGNSLSEVIQYSAVNFLLIAFQLGLTTLYFTAKNKKFTNIFNTYLGAGDVIFFLVIIFCFSPVNFILFIIASGLITILFYASRTTKILIPLAGSQSIFLCLILFSGIIFKIIQPFSDSFLFDLFVN
jgi:hypothetical protein